MEGTLPPEIHTEILIRLPVESLLRFRCVSKAWRSQIDDPAFIKTHLKKSTGITSSLNVILTDVNPEFLYWASFDSLNTAMEDSPVRFHKLDYPFKGSSDASPNVRIVGACNGLLCLGNAAGRIVLMNPSTKKHFILPYLIMNANSHVKGKLLWGSWTFGFGYDSVHDDYIVVRLGQYVGVHERYFGSDTMIYSLQRNSWRKIDGMPYILGFDQKMGTLVGDVLHWLVDRNQILPNPDVIIGFDLGVEDFREVPGPELVAVGKDQNRSPAINLGTVEKWLALYAIYEAAPTRLDIWVMKEYGVKDSWTRLFSFTPKQLPLVKCMRTLFFSKNGDEVLLGLQGSNLIWYNTKHKRVKLVDLHTAVSPFTIEAFRGSLVPLNVNKETAVKKARPKKGRKKRDEFLSKGFKLAL